MSRITSTSPVPSNLTATLARLLGLNVFSQSHSGCNRREPHEIIRVGSSGSARKQRQPRRLLSTRWRYVTLIKERLAKTIQRVEKANGRPAPLTAITAMLVDPGVDAVLIATTDHWHALPTSHACEGGRKFTAKSRHPDGRRRSCHGKADRAHPPHRPERSQQRRIPSSDSPVNLSGPAVWAPSETSWLGSPR